MIQWVLGAIFALTILFVYACIVRPKKEIEQYKKMFQSKGYKVKLWPFKPMGVATLTIVFGDSKNGDAFKTYKSVYPHYDVAIGNYLNKPLIQFLNADLRNQFGKAEREYNYLKLPMLTRLLKRALGSGVVLSQGQQWKRKKKIMSQLFTFDLIKRNYQKIADICSDSMVEHEKNSQISPGICQYDSMQLFGQMFSAITSELFLGGNCSREEINGKKVAIFYIDLINDVNVQAKSPLAIILGPKFLNIGLTSVDKDINERISLLNGWGTSYVQKRLSEQIEKLKAKKNKYECTDVISAFIKKNSDEELSNFSKFQIFQEFKLFFLAGTDTTAHFTQMLIYYLVKYPEVQQKVREEIAELAPGQDYSPQTMKKLIYIDGAQKETTRLYGPTNFILPRAVARDHYVNGIPIKKSTVVQYYSVGSHYNQQIYQDPLSFKPERWLKQDSASAASINLTGFGVGARSCPGKNMALFESKVALIKFLKRYSKIEIDGDVGIRWKFLYVPDDFKIRVTLAK